MVSDVLIIGGGIIGLSIARELHLQGVRKITLVERGAVGREASWAAAGMLAPNIEATVSQDFHKFGTDSLSLYPDLATDLLDETGIDIELDRTGTLFVAFDDADVEDLQERYTIQKAAGFSTERLSRDEILKSEPQISGQVREGLFFPDDWQVENRKLVAGLIRSAQINGIQILEQTEVFELLTEAGKIAGVRTPGGDLTAGVTVLATGAWTSLIKIGDLAVPVSIKPVRGQMIRFAGSRLKISRVLFSPRGYLVPRADGSILAGATVEEVGFDKTVTADGVDSLTTASVEIAPKLHGLEIVEKWAGLRPFAADGLPVLGGIPGYDNLLLATAHYRNGILLAPETARVIADKIVNGADSELLRIFGVARFEQATNATAHR